MEKFSPKYEWGSPEENLTTQQLTFVEEYLFDLNAKRAARRAGYAPATAARLLRKPHIRAAIKRRMDERKERLKLSEEYVINRLIKEAEYEGEAGNATARVRALELLGKHLGMFWDRQETVQRSEVVYVEVAPVDRKVLEQQAQALPEVIDARED